jgi:hypothetical protein
MAVIPGGGQNSGSPAAHVDGLSLRDVRSLAGYFSVLGNKLESSRVGRRLGPRDGQSILFGVFWFFTDLEHRMLKTFVQAGVIAGAVAGFAALGACEDGSSEKAGESLDSALEKAVDGKEDKGDGVFEKAGEAADKATGSTNDDALDALSDATDGDKSTKPD